MKPKAGLLAICSAALLTGNASAEDFKFDASEFDKKTFEFSGYIEQKEEWLKMRGDSAAYKLANPNAGEHDQLLRSTTTLELAAKVNLDPFVIDARTRSLHSEDALLYKSTYNQVLEGGVRWSAGPDLTLDIGKRVQRWGKGYAWNPVGFVEIPKDASDPQASREGFVMASTEWSKSFSNAGPLSSIGLTALVVPTNSDMNQIFGKKEALNPAAKISALAWDTDFDVMWLGEGARPQSFGADFSRNVSSALEVHGEWARTLDASYNTLDAKGIINTQTRDLNSWLLGLRYLTASEVTLIGEYYHNGAGYSANQLDDYYQFLDQALTPNAPPALVSKARAAAQAGYGKPNAANDYLYLKASVSEPFNWLYSAAALTTTSNVHDGSYQITPEISYTGISNLELRARLFLFGGQPHAEFTEKISSSRLEIYARYFF